MEFDITTYLDNTSYINKDFQSIWEDVLDTVPKLTSKWNPAESLESDPLVALLKEMTICTDMINYNIDKNILELFPWTLTQERSAYNVYPDLGYTPDWYKSAVTTITISYNGMVGSSVLTVSELASNSKTFTVPRFTAFSSDDSSLVFTSLEDATFNTCTVSKRTVNAIEGSIVDLEVNGSKQILSSNLDAENKLYLKDNTVAQNGIFISNYEDFSDVAFSTVAGVIGDGVTTTTISTASTNEQYEVWTRVDNLNQYLAGNKIYKLGIDPSNNTVYLQFPEDIGTLIEDGIYIKYIVSEGENGNIDAYNISKFLNAFEVEIDLASGYTDEEGATITYTLTESNLDVSNTKSVQNGANPLTIEEMRREYSRTAGTFNTLVTIRDYENYIYNYEDAYASSVVSNIRVSDRTCDLEYSLTYEYMQSNGKIVSVSIPLPAEGGEGDTDNKENAMTAFDLKLYPLQPLDSIESKEDFDATFNLTGDRDFIVAGDELRNLNLIVQSAISDAKVINHDFLDPAGYPILIPYDLEGQIGLNIPVAQTVADDILENVSAALYSSLNSHELDWGKQISYNDVYNIIKDADKRISVVGLNAVQYGDPITYDGFDGNGYDVIERSILKGCVAWTTYTAFTYDYGMEFEQGGIIHPVTQMQSRVDIDNKDAANTYIVGPNETFTLLIPKYKTVTTYGNYLYVILFGAGSVTANVPTKLDSDQKIYVYMTRDAAQDAIERYSDGDSSPFAAADYTIKNGTIILSSRDLTFKEGNDISTGDIVNLASTDTIDVIQRSEGKIESSNYITGAQTLEQAKVLVATTSKNINEHFKSGSTDYSYTLFSDEYVFVTDELGSEYSLFGEGTTITSDTFISAEEPFKVIEDASTINSLLNNKLKASVYSSWTSIPSGTLSYQLNELKAFGENYVLAFEDASANGGQGTYKAALENYLTNQFFPVVFDDGNPVTIKYQLADKEDLTDSDTYSKQYTIDSQAWETIDRVSEDDNYQAIIRLMILTSPGIEQTLTWIDENNTLLVDEETSDDGSTEEALIFADTTQRIEVSTDASDPYILQYDEEVGDTSFQASVIITSEGGTVLTYDAEDDVNLLWYAGSIYANAYDENEFLALKILDEEGTENSTLGGSSSDEEPIKYKRLVSELEVPGEWNDTADDEGNVIQDVAIIPYVSESESTISHFIAVRGGAILYFDPTLDPNYDPDNNYTDLTYDGREIHNDWLYVGRPYLVSRDAVYYDKNISDKYLSVASLLSTDIEKKLEASEIYYKDYCPLIVPSSNDLIEDPEAGFSYFYSQHPYNRYSLPWMRSLDRLTINPSDIIST